MAINTGADAEYMAYQFKVHTLIVRLPSSKPSHRPAARVFSTYHPLEQQYDSVHGRFDGSVDVEGDDLIINGQRVKTTHTRKVRTNSHTHTRLPPGLSHRPAARVTNLSNQTSPPFAPFCPHVTKKPPTPNTTS